MRLHPSTISTPRRNQHLRLLSSQYLARALHPNHPSHHLVSAPPPPGHRKLKHSLRSKCLDDVSPFLQDGVLRGSTKETLDRLHTKVVDETKASFGPNRVLGTAAPDIHPSESTLPRATRATLSQLRSGHCSKLQTYRHRLGRVDDDLCPDCRVAPHSTSHLFECTAKPTNLTTISLWERPRDAAAFISSLTNFQDLPSSLSPPLLLFFSLSFFLFSLLCFQFCLFWHFSWRFFSCLLSSF